MDRKNQYSFVWDLNKEKENLRKHGVDFMLASQVFFDVARKVFVDEKHSKNEERYFCIGKVGEKIVTVRFVYRRRQIRIIGAGYCRKGKVYYEKA